MTKSADASRDQPSPERHPAHRPEVRRVAGEERRRVLHERADVRVEDRERDDPERGRRRRSRAGAASGRREDVREDVLRQQRRHPEKERDPQPVPLHGAPHRLHARRRRAHAAAGRACVTSRPTTNDAHIASVTTGTADGHAQREPVRVPRDRPHHPERRAQDRPGGVEREERERPRGARRSAGTRRTRRPTRAPRGRAGARTAARGAPRQGAEPR